MCVYDPETSITDTLAPSRAEITQAAKTTVTKQTEVIQHIIFIWNFSGVVCYKQFKRKLFTPRRSA